MFALTTGITGMVRSGTHNAMTAKDDYCFNFDGIDEYVNTTITGNELMVNNEFTIAAWVRLADGDAASQFTCGLIDGHNAIYLGISAGFPYFLAQSDDGDYSYGLANDLALGNGDVGWVFLAGKVDSNLAYVSLNGSTWDNDNDSGFLHGDYSSTKNIWIGCYNNGDAFANGMTGKISSIMFFNKALSQSELNDLYSMGNVGEVHPKYAVLESDLLAWYRMGDDAGDSLNPNFADDDCADDKLSLWTVEADIALTHSGDHYELNYTNNGSSRRLYLDHSAISIADIVKISVDLKGDLGGEKIHMGANQSMFSVTLTDSYVTYSRTGTISSIASSTYLPKLMFFSSNGSQSNISMQNFKVELVDAGGDPIGAASLTDASSNSNTGTPTNMEIGDIVEDSP